MVQIINVKGLQIPMTFTKADIIEVIYRNLGGMTRTEIHRAVDAILDICCDGLERGEPVSISGFGSFRLNPRAARLVRMPDGGLSTATPRMRIRFTPSPKLKTRINGAQT